MKTLSNTIHLNRMIFKALSFLLKLNANVYGTGASYEVCRDLAAGYRR